MRCLLLADRDIALREAALLHRLVIGLLDAGVHVTHAAPQSVLDRIEPSLGVEILPYRARGMPWTRGVRSAQLLEQFEIATEVSGGEPGLVHAFGAECVPVALDIARAGNLAVVIDVHSRAMASNLVRQVGEGFEGVLLAGSSPLARVLLASGIAASGVRECQWGVSKVEPVARPGHETLSIAVGGRGASPEAWGQCLRGLAQVAAHRENLAIFVDSDAAERAAIGRMVGSLGLSPLVSRVPDFEARRDLVVHADVLLWPERLGEIRSVVLDTMAAGTPIICLADPDVPALSDPSIAAHVSGDASDWAAAIESIASRDERRQAMANAALDYVRTAHSAPGHVGAVVDAYEWATASIGRRGDE